MKGVMFGYVRILWFLFKVFCFFFFKFWQAFTHLDLAHCSYSTFVDCGSMNICFSEPLWYYFVLFDLCCAGGFTTGPCSCCLRMQNKLPQDRVPGASRHGKGIPGPLGLRALPGQVLVAGYPLTIRNGGCLQS